jgi:hypothetical protein
MAQSNHPIRYWQGMATGILAGLAAAFVLPRITSLTKARPSADSVLRGVQGPAEPAGRPFLSRRDSPESAGDPATTAPGHGNASEAFNLPGGAPGPRQRGEQLTMPGRPGQSLTYDDPAQQVRISRRTVDISSH